MKLLSLTVIVGLAFGFTACDQKPGAKESTGDKIEKSASDGKAATDKAGGKITESTKQLTEATKESVDKAKAAAEAAAEKKPEPEPTTDEAINAPSN